MESGNIALSLNAEIGRDRTQWVQLLPAGTFHGRDGRGPYKIANPHALIAASQKLVDRDEARVDYGHEYFQGANNGASAENAGFIKKYEVRNGSIWALVQWTETAARKITERAFRGISPVFKHDISGFVQCIIGAGLTNKPNLDLLALSCEAPMTDLRTRLLSELSLPGTASDDDIVIAVGELTAAHRAHARNTGESDVRSSEAYARLASDYLTLQAAVEMKELEEAVNNAIQAGKLTPAQRNSALELGRSNKTAFMTMLDQMPAHWAHLFQKRNPAGASPPPWVRNDETAVDEVAHNLGHDAAAVRANLSK